MLTEIQDREVVYYGTSVACQSLLDFIFSRSNIGFFAYVIGDQHYNQIELGQLLGGFL